MRLLIGFYLLLGVGQIGLPFLFGLGRLDSSPPWEIFFGNGLLTLFAAYGLWKRWRLMRLVLLGLSWWVLAVCALAASVALAMLAGWTDGRVLGVNDPPGVTLSMALAIAALPVLQLWLLLRSPVRDAFRRRA